MSSINFVDQQTVIPALWLNDVNSLVWGVFNGATTAALARAALDVSQTGTDTTYAFRANNLSDLANTTTARTNIGAAASGANTDITSLNSPALGAATATTQAYNDNSTKVATTAMVQSALSTAFPTVRQTVLYGPVDSNGAPNFGGSTGSGTVTITGTIYPTFAGGITNYTPSAGITSASWTGLTTNGTMYLYLDYNTGTGAITTGSTTLAPVYQWGGTSSVTNGQHTFNIQQMTMYVGNGSTASQVFRVFVGEVTVAANVVSAITWYALMGRYRSATTATLPSITTNPVTVTHNLGVNADAVYSDPQAFAICTTTDAGWAVGTVTRLLNYISGSAVPGQTVLKTGRNTMALQSGNTSTGWVINNFASGGQTGMTLASWSYWTVISRGW